MKNDSTRVVLGFYASEEQYAEGAWRAIRSLSPQARIYRGSDGDGTGPTARDKYPLLRLNDEELVVAEVAAAKVPAAISILRNAGEPGVFIARRDELAEPPAPSDKTIYSWRGILDRLKESEAT